MIEQTFVDVADLFDVERAEAEAARLAARRPAPSFPGTGALRGGAARCGCGWGRAGPRRVAPIGARRAALQEREAVGVEQVAAVGRQRGEIVRDAAVDGAEAGQQAGEGVVAAFEHLFAQAVGIRQIVDEYGPNESIVSNCHVRIAYAPNQYDTAELLSKMTGTKTVQKATFNFSGSRLAPIANHMSATVDQVERPLVTPDEVMRLRPPTKSGHGAAERIAAPGDMLIFVSGNYPIYGTQILYFTDPVLAKRADLAPPSNFPAIEDGHVIAQRRADRTRNAISAAEPRQSATSSSRAASTARSPMEEAFWKEMGDDHVATDLPSSPVSTGFTEQLDLDLHESEI